MQRNRPRRLRGSGSRCLAVSLSAEVMDENDSCRPAFMKLDIKRKSYGPAMILGEAPRRQTGPCGRGGCKMVYVCGWGGGGWASGQTGVPNRWRRSDLERVCSPDRRPVARCSCGTSSRSSAEGFLGVGRWRSWPNGQGGLARVPRGADVMDL